MAALTARVLADKSSGADNGSYFYIAERHYRQTYIFVSSEVSPLRKFVLYEPKFQSFERRIFSLIEMNKTSIKCQSFQRPNLEVIKTTLAIIIVANEFKRLMQACLFSYLKVLRNQKETLKLSSVSRPDCCTKCVRSPAYACYTYCPCSSSRSDRFNFLMLIKALLRTWRTHYAWTSKSLVLYFISRSSPLPHRDLTSMYLILVLQLDPNKRSVVKVEEILFFVGGLQHWQMTWGRTKWTDARRLLIFFSCPKTIYHFRVVHAH